MTTRKDLHELVDWLPECVWEETRQYFLEHLKQHEPMGYTLFTAPVEEPMEDEITAMEESYEDIRTGKGYWISHEEIMRRYGGIVIMWQVRWRNRAGTELAGLPGQDRRRVLSAINVLAETNRGDIIKLRARTGEWRLRVGNWRVILTFNRANRTIEIQRVLHRSQAYR